MVVQFCLPFTHRTLCIVLVYFSIWGFMGPSTTLGGPLDGEYIIRDVQRTRRDAQVECQVKGYAGLAVLDSLEKLNYVKSLQDFRSLQYWVGVKQTDQVNPRTDTFRWDAPLANHSYIPWHPQAPEFLSYKFCARIRQGFLQDARCSRAFFYICEKEYDVPPPPSSSGAKYLPSVGSSNPKTAMTSSTIVIATDSTTFSTDAISTPPDVSSTPTPTPSSGVPSSTPYCATSANSPCTNIISASSTEGTFTTTIISTPTIETTPYAVSTAPNNPSIPTISYGYYPLIHKGRFPSDFNETYILFRGKLRSEPECTASCAKDFRCSYILYNVNRQRCFLCSTSLENDLDSLVRVPGWRIRVKRLYYS